ncbi:MAG: hypothetical protein ACR2OE_17915 [Thermomicrobiales bacterium]
MNTQQTAIILHVLRSVWPNTEINANTVKAYQWALEDLTYAEGERAAKTWMRTGKFFPKPAELREIIGNETAGMDEIAESAWSEVQREVRRVGFNRPSVFSGGKFQESPIATFSSDLIRQTVDSLTWRLICTTDEPEKLRDQFLWTYKALRKRDVSRIQRGTISAGETLPANVSAMKEIAS